MNPNYTDITFVLDRSGSMEIVRSDTIGGFNTFIKGHREDDGKCLVTLVQFDHEYLAPFCAQDVRYIPLLTNRDYVPRGRTALLDAMARSIRETGDRLRALREEERPGKVLVVSLTDGLENASREFVGPEGFARVQQMIQHQHDIYRWEFVFLGANQDAIATAARMGIGATHAMTYGANALGTQDAFQSITTNTRLFKTGVAASASFNVSDYAKQTNAGVDPSQNAQVPGSN